MTRLLGWAAWLCLVAPAAALRASSVPPALALRQDDAFTCTRRASALAVERLLSLRGGAEAAEERTYAMIKPDVSGDEEALEAIRQLISGAGLTIVREESCRLSQRQCRKFYAEHKGRPFFPGLVAFMSSGPVVKLELAGPDAVRTWRALLGPTNSLKARKEAPKSVRGLFGTDQQRNAAHGSDALESAERELKLMFK
jgi:nucleoside-diphosphate kinase